MWGKANTDVLHQFVSDRGPTDQGARAVLAVALLAGSTDALLFAELERLEKRHQTFDSGILLDILSAAKPSLLPGVLWSPVGLHLSSPQFQRLYRIALGSRLSLGDLYELTGAAVDFLRLNPGVFSLPRAKVLRLIKSQNVEWRLVALKALKHCEIPLRAHVEWILHFLRSRNESEKDIGLHELGEILAQNELGIENLGEAQLGELRRALCSMKNSSNRVRRRAAQVRLESVGGLLKVGQ